MSSGAVLKLECSNFVVTEGGKVSAYVIETSTSFDISVDFKIGGHAGCVDWFVAASGSVFEFAVNAESMGSGNDVILGPVLVKPKAGQTRYTATITDNTLSIGSYKLLGIVKSLPILLPLPIAGYLEGPTIEIIQCDIAA